MISGAFLVSVLKFDQKKFGKEIMFRFPEIIIFWRIFAYDLAWNYRISNLKNSVAFLNTFIVKFCYFFCRLVILFIHDFVDHINKSPTVGKKKFCRAVLTLRNLIITHRSKTSTIGLFGLQVILLEEESSAIQHLKATWFVDTKLINR